MMALGVPRRGANSELSGAHWVIFAEHAGKVSVSGQREPEDKQKCIICTCDRFRYINIEYYRRKKFYLSFYIFLHIYALCIIS